MVICPVCEHQQEFGLECEQCGKDLGGLADLPPPPTRDERLADLLVREETGAVAAEPLEGVERTAFEPAEAATEVTPDLERTSYEEPPDVAIVPVTDLSADRAVETEPRTPVVSDRVTCRYCRHVQSPQRLCQRCGMSLASPSVSPPAVVRIAEGEARRCPACGAPAHVGARCGDCGCWVGPVED